MNGTVHFTHCKRAAQGALEGQTIYYYNDDIHVYAVWGMDRAQVFCPIFSTIVVNEEGQDPFTVPMPIVSIVMKSYCVRQ